MFSKKDTPSHDAGQPLAQPKRSAMKAQAPSILSADLTITGSIMSDGEVQLDGQVSGDVQAGTLTIGEEASVQGEVVADAVVIRGRVEGSVRAPGPARLDRPHRGRHYPLHARDRERGVFRRQLPSLLRSAERQAGAVQVVFLLRQLRPEAAERAALGPACAQAGERGERHADVRRRQAEGGRRRRSVQELGRTASECEKGGPCGPPFSLSRDSAPTPPPPRRRPSRPVRRP